MTHSESHQPPIHSFMWMIVRPFQNDIRQWVGGRIDEPAAEKVAASEAAKDVIAEQPPYLIVFRRAVEHVVAVRAIRRLQH